MIFVNNAKYIHFQPIFPTSSCPFTLHVETIQNMNQILLILLQIVVKLFVRNRIFGISYNLRKYLRYKHVLKLFAVIRSHLRSVTALNPLN